MGCGSDYYLLLNTEESLTPIETTTMGNLVANVRVDKGEQNDHIREDVYRSNATIGKRMRRVQYDCNY